MLDYISLFIKLYETKSFKKCAELMNTSPSTISKHIAELEYNLGRQLITRTPKTFEPTAYGKYVYDNLKNVPAFTEAVLKSYDEKQPKNEETGSLNVALGTAISYELISPYLDDFLESHPNVKLNIKYSSDITTWPSEDTNIVLGVAAIDQPNLDSRFIRSEKGRLYCRKEYALKYGLPNFPEQLLNHKLINTFYHPNLKTHLMMHNSKTSATYLLDLSNVKIRINNLLHMKKVGMSLDYIFGSNDALVAQDIHNGSVINVLPDWYFFEVNFYLISRKTITPLEQAFINFIYNCMNRSYNLIIENSIDRLNQKENMS